MQIKGRSKQRFHLSEGPMEDQRVQTVIYLQFFMFTHDDHGAQNKSLSRQPAYTM